MKYYCGECGNTCDTVRLDFGYGPYEAWGVKGVHENFQTVSKCCEEVVYEDEELTEEVHFD